MKSLKLAIFLTATFVATGCTTVVFDNGPGHSSIQKDVTRTHHIGGVFELVEFSRPENLEKLCDGKNWNTVTTEKTFGNGFVGAIVPYGIYSPKTLYVDCAE